VLLLQKPFHGEVWNITPGLVTSDLAPVGEEGVAICKCELHFEPAFNVIKVLHIHLQHEQQMETAVTNISNDK
jgi:hypothetical protein